MLLQSLPSFDLLVSNLFQIHFKPCRGTSAACPNLSPSQAATTAPLCSEPQEAASVARQIVLSAHQKTPTGRREQDSTGRLPHPETPLSEGQQTARPAAIPPSGLRFSR